jgi:large subunit ribosomal protein L15
MRLHQIKHAEGAKHRTKRVGCGESSGHGKTSCRGGKGQTARSGSSIRHGFEGGQTPLYRRLPKRGFNNTRFKLKVIPINLSSLNEFDNGQEVNLELFKSKGLINGRFDAVKILGDGELKKKLKVHAHLFSASAKAKIESAGGSTEVVRLPWQDRDDRLAKSKAAKSKGETKAKAKAGGREAAS